jgi:hypothetical protein
MMHVPLLVLQFVADFTSIPRGAYCGQIGAVIFKIESDKIFKFPKNFHLTTYCNYRLAAASET